MTTAESYRLVELTELALTGSITNDAFAELQETLRGSEEARALYLEHSTMDPMLRWIMTEQAEAAVPTAASGSRPILSDRLKPALQRILPLAAAIVAGALLFFGLRPDGTPKFLTLENEVRVELSDDAVFVNEGTFSLQRGEAMFLVGEAGKGFTVEVPHGRIVDLGTAFSVSISETGDASVSVLSGEVRVEQAEVHTHLAAGESGILTNAGWIAETTRPKREASDYDRLVEQSSPVSRWSFTGQPGAWLADLGSVKLIRGPQGAFARNNTAAFFGGSGSIRIPDRGEQSEFDFAQGDEITLEAWVKLEKPLGDNLNVYVIGKGRTQNLGYSNDNQNFSLRLRGQNGAACVSFLFRTPGQGREANFHRWTTDTGILPDLWHHVAVSYRYGNPDSVRGYIDGEPIAGAWDMGGATAEAPVVDDDEVWIGSSMAESANNTFPGAIDEVAIYRKQLSDSVLRQHATAIRRER